MTGLTNVWQLLPGPGDDRHRAEQTAGRGTFVPLIFQPGEAFQFDWSQDWANIGGERVKLQVAHIKLSHWHAFRVFGGVPGRGIYDNMKTAVDRVGKGKQRDINARFKAMYCPAGDCKAICREGQPLCL